MTDFETLTDLFAKRGIVAETGKHEPYKLDDIPEMVDTTLLVHEGKGPRNTGYTSFLTSFYFDADRKLIGIGAWE